MVGATSTGKTHSATYAQLLSVELWRTIRTRQQQQAWQTGFYAVLVEELSSKVAAPKWRGKQARPPAQEARDRGSDEPETSWHDKLK